MAWIAQQLLTAIRDEPLLDCFTEAVLIELTRLTPKQVENAANTLRRNGLLSRSDEGCYMLTTAGHEALKHGAHVTSGPHNANQTGRRVRTDTLRVRIWRAIRIRRKFTVPEIISLVADGTERGDITSNVQKYIRALAKAGYLVELPRREAGAAITSNGYKRWWLQDDKDTGPKAPVWSREKQRVYDPNTEETHDISAKEAQP